MAFKIDQEKCNGCGACARICPNQAIAGEKKKAHAVNEPDCIACGVCGRVCPRGAVIDEAGRPAVAAKRSEWPKPAVAIKLCIACAGCVETCPVGCLVMSNEAREGGEDAYPFLKDEKACIACGFCQVECPVDAIAPLASGNRE